MFKFLKKTEVPDRDDLFKSNGEFNLTEDLATVLDAILIIISNEGGVGIDKLQYHLLRCGILVPIPDLKLILNKLREEQLIG